VSFYRCDLCGVLTRMGLRHECPRSPLLYPAGPLPDYAALHAENVRLRAVADAAREFVNFGRDTEGECSRYNALGTALRALDSKETT
jgi:hypothetical protein